VELKIFYAVVIFVFGLIFGSFYNVVGWRLPIGLSLVRPSGSFCPKCKHKLRWYENIPVFSWLIQGGKCRSCKKPIPKFYIIIELLTGILFALSYWIFGFSFEFVLAILISSFFVIVVVSDSNFLVIPDEVTVVFSILVILARFILVGASNAILYLGYGLGAFLVMYLLMLFGNFIFKKESLGGGDIKLMFFIGCCLGPWMSLFTIFLSSFIALPLSLILYFRSKDSVIPFGPFLLIATLIIVVFKLDVYSVLNMILNIGV
jgi:leader peptidase (prepilin peptidase)/N-methyltransferase